jgi:hypothetical protein
VRSAAGARDPVAARWPVVSRAQPAGLPARGRGRQVPHEALLLGSWRWRDGPARGVRNGSPVPQQNMAGAVIWLSSPPDMMLSARGRRKPSIACISDATVRALPGRRAARRSTSSRSSGAAAAAAGLSPWPSSRRYTRRGAGLRSAPSEWPTTGAVARQFHQQSPVTGKIGEPGRPHVGSPPGRRAIGSGPGRAQHFAAIQYRSR